MFKLERRVPETQKINLIPIMDAIFIFIFFLLFSSQFLKMYEIESDAPIIREVPAEEKLDKDPLNLIVKITRTEIIITTGVNSNVHKKISRESARTHEVLKESVLLLRQEYQDDDYAIISPAPNIPYEDIVDVIGAVQGLPSGMEELNLPKSKKNKRVSKIFSQVVLEPLDKE